MVEDKDIHSLELLNIVRAAYNNGMAMKYVTKWRNMGEDGRPYLTMLVDLTPTLGPVECMCAVITSYIIDTFEQNILEPSFN